MMRDELKRDEVDVTLSRYFHAICMMRLRKTMKHLSKPG
jgi:hypothetical protein